MIYKGKLEVRKEDCQTMKVATHHEHSSFAFTETFQSLYQKLGVADKKVLYDYITSQVTGLSEITDEVKKVLNKLLNSLNISSEDLANAIKLYGKNVNYIPDFEKVVSYLKENVKENDIIITLGAGTVTKLGPMILGNE